MQIQTRNDRVGEKQVAKNGITMTIIEYRANNDIDIQFEDGTIVTNKTYQNFKNGRIGHPNVNSTAYVKKKNYEKLHIGEKVYNKHNQLMEIVDYLGTSNITVKFEDGVTVKTSYTKFKQGNVHKTPYIKDRTGETSVNNQGLKMTIVGYRNSRDIDIQFEDGTVRRNLRYDLFKKGSVMCVNDHIGETYLSKCGLEMTLTAYRGCHDIDVQFENGEVVQHKRYSAFLDGSIAIETYNNSSKIDRLHEEIRSKAGQKMSIIEYRNTGSIDVQFEDGTIAYNKTYINFKKGYIPHPKYYKVIEAYTFKSKKYFLCACRKCRNRHVLALDEMKDFECAEGKK